MSPRRPRTRTSSSRTGTPSTSPVATPIAKLMTEQGPEEPRQAKPTARRRFRCHIVCITARSGANPSVSGTNTKWKSVVSANCQRASSRAVSATGVICGARRAPRHRGRSRSRRRRVRCTRHPSPRDNRRSGHGPALTVEARSGGKAGHRPEGVIRRLRARASVEFPRSVVGARAIAGRPERGARFARPIGSRRTLRTTGS